MSIQLKHEKLVVPDNSFGHLAYADLYVLGEKPPEDVPLVLFIGGAITSEVYQARLETRPDNLASTFQVSCEARNVREAAFLAVPCPYGNPSRKSMRIQDMAALILEGFFKPSRIVPLSVKALIGNSMGAYLGTGILPCLPGVSVFVAIAGVGMIQAAEENPRSEWPRSMSCYSNSGDVLREHTLEFMNWTQGRGIGCSLTTRDGSHAFADYERNGSVLDAFSSAASGISSVE